MEDSRRDLGVQSKRLPEAVCHEASTGRVVDCGAVGERRREARESPSCGSTRGNAGSPHRRRREITPSLGKDRYIERAITGLKLDVALVASIFANQIHDFTPRLLKALNNPRILLPTHWDNFEAPFSEPPRDLRDTFGDPANLDLWVKEVQKLSPKSKVVTMKYFESFAL